MRRPRVSVIVAAYNAEATIEAALDSVLRQTMAELEIVVADDGSTDATPSLLRAIAARDGRVRVLPPAARGGPAAARNRCLDAARGAWIAVFDADDLMHPERLEGLLAEAAHSEAEIVADDLLLFEADPAVPPRPLLRGRPAFWVGPAAYVAANTMVGRAAPLGYLKPLIGAGLLARSGVRYDPGLRIGEDYDLVLRLLLAGGRLRVIPALTYFYRRHAGSVSHRLTGADIEALLGADARLAQRCDPGLRPALARRSAMLLRALAFDGLVQALKRRHWAAALAGMLRRPDAALLLWRPVAAAVRRTIRRGADLGRGIPDPDPAQAPAQAVVISRQRLVGATSGSSRYLLDLVETVASCGMAVHLVVASSAVFGRTPVLRLDAAMAVFASIRMQGTIRLGRWVVAADPLIWRRAAVGALGTVLRRPAWRRVAPYSVAVPWTRADLLFVARHARRADAIIADYAFTTPAIAYALRPDAPSLVVMHDLFSDRAGRPEQIAASDPAIVIGRPRELHLLGLADGVVAIQPAEAASVQAGLPDSAVLVAPMPVRPVAEPQPGEAEEVLFVGTKATPNVIGLRRFLDEAWPAIVQARPQARMTVCGGVGGVVGALPAGVQAAGFVADLAPVYRRAAIAVMPLPFGSGLKVKLVEALGHGKAIVASEAALQGVPPRVAAAVWHAEGPAATAAAVIALLADPALRQRYADAALAAARAEYDAEACHQAFRDFLLARVGRRHERPAASDGHVRRAHQAAWADQDIELAGGSL